ncbi:glutamyl-tRNA reductase [Thermohalobacter berrensis]|uniref:Glutamyl-tRNA reductase n=1 Tax=Thermohalobacter berrensis TaxID=99594 RepID=A0A419SZD0_9FIRM|nr:glutamyl-tRNA reductase [Thermohalobacter berrensis]RKD30620.1 glutamyl-tRNA reductase [Thermohalobacter berrensis]
MKIAVVGVNHDTAPAKVREKVSFTDSKKIEATNYLLDEGIKEVVILSTCNRSEIYIADREKKISEKIKIIKDFYKNYSKANNIENYLFVKEGKEALFHLYSVAVGLKSIVLGEDQILGQVKDAHTFAMELGASKKILNKLFREAVTTAKNIKSQLKISEHPLSVSYIGIKFLKEQLGSLEGKKALVIGLGKMGRLALEYLLEEKLDKVYMSNRSHERVVNIKKCYPKVNPIDYDERYNILNEVDILVTATASPHTIIKSEDMPTLEKELYIMDMAMPRDVDDKVKDISKVYLFNIDDLKKISSENEKKREELSRRAKDIINSDIDEFINWLKTIKVDPVIKALNRQCSKVQEDTLEYIYRKLELNSREKKIIQKMLNSALKRIIRNPILKLKELDDEEKLEEYIELLDNLFEFNME